MKSKCSLGLWIGLLALPLAGAESPTFHDDVATIIHRNCSVCHRPGGSGPFNLMTYEDVRKRGKQIVEVTSSGFMPPWLPERHAEFLGGRKLPQRDLATLTAWVETGMAKGAGEAPPLPDAPAAWPLGKPDLIVQPEEAYLLPAEAGADVFRNLVIRLPIQSARYVRAVDFKAANPQVVHHAILKIDRSGTSRALDAKDPLPGYGDDMNLPRALNPDGHFLGWTPGKRPYSDKESAWMMRPGEDLVIQLHLQPSGKPETIQPEIALYFADKAPSKRPVGVLLYNADFKIRAGAVDQRVSDKFTVPVDALVSIVYPHAHYRGKSVHVLAKKPDGGMVTLLSIPEWDFNWQDSYHYRKPVLLPAGTDVTMDWRFDNSKENVRNPVTPPVDVGYGLRTVDEMASVWIQLLPARPADASRLHAGVDRHRITKQLVRGYEILAKRPDDLSTRLRVASLYMSQRNYKKAEAQFDEMLKLKPDSYEALRGKADLYRATRRSDEAIALYRESLKIRVADPEVLCNIGTLYHMKSQHVQAEAFYQRSLKHAPGQKEARCNLAILYADNGQILKAKKEFEKARDYFPADPAILQRLGKVYVELNEPEAARACYEQAVRLNPGDSVSRAALGALPKKK